jgi:hypothetical protein
MAPESVVQSCLMATKSEVQSTTACTPGLYTQISFRRLNCLNEYFCHAIIKTRRQGFINIFIAKSLSKSRQLWLLHERQSHPSNSTGPPGDPDRNSKNKKCITTLSRFILCRQSKRPSTRRDDRLRAAIGCPNDLLIEIL